MKSKSIILSALAERTGATLIGNPETVISGVATLEEAEPHEASFLAVPRYGQPDRYLQMMRASKAGVIFLSRLPEGADQRNYLLCANPTLAFQEAILFFFEDCLAHTGFSGIHESAVIHPTATIGKDVTIGPNAVIDRECHIGDRSSIGSGCVVGLKSTIGTDCILHSNVTIRERCTLGNRVTIQPGAVIGSCGFGYTQSPEGKHIKLHQLGTVVIEDDVCIGANTAIDRARFTTTRIGRGTKIDNLVQIAHGVEIGEDAILCGQSGVAGSTKIGKHCVIGPQTGIAPHLELAPGVELGGKCGVTKSLKRGRYLGFPAMPVAEHNKNAVLLRNIEKYVAMIHDLNKRVN